MKTWRKYRVLFWLLLPLFGIGLAQVARGQTGNGPPYLAWTHVPNPAFLGGLSTNDFYTNVSFVVYSWTNVTDPLSSWTNYATLWATNVAGYPGPNWTQYITPDVPFRAFVVQAQNNVTNSPFSGVAVGVWSLLPGQLKLGR